MAGIDTLNEGQISTNYAAKYNIVRFIPIIEIEYDNGYVEHIPDTLNWNITKLLNNITEFEPVIFDGSIPLTTIVYRYYGTTTLTWLVEMYNGIVQPLEIVSGSTINMPSITEIDNMILKLERKVQEYGIKRVEI